MKVTKPNQRKGFQQWFMGTKSNQPAGSVNHPSQSEQIENEQIRSTRIDHLTSQNDQSVLPTDSLVPAASND